MPPWRGQGTEANGTTSYPALPRPGFKGLGSQAGGLGPRGDRFYPAEPAAAFRHLLLIADTRKGAPVRNEGGCVTNAGRGEARGGPLRAVRMSGQAVEETGRKRQEWGWLTGREGGACASLGTGRPLGAEISRTRASSWS